MRAETELAPRRGAPVTWSTGRLWATALAVAAPMLAFDLALPLGIAGGIPYVAVVLLGLRSRSPDAPLRLAALGTALTLVGWLGSPEHSPLWVVATNRLLACFAIWVVAVVCSLQLRGARRLQEAHAELERARDALEDRVAARTRELSQANRALEAAHAERLETEQKLRQARAAEAVGHLARGIAHDFNNLLAGILGNADLLVGQLPPGSQEADDAAAIMQLAEQGASRTRQLLALGHREVKQRGPVELGALVWGLQKTLLRLLRDEVAVKLEVSPEPVWIDGDESEIAQVLLNLIANARDAMQGRGEVALEVDAVTLDAERSCVRSTLAPGRYARLAVTDTGPGMAPELRERIFDAYFTTKAQGQGTGLGLALVVGVARAHGGGVELRSEPGEGATFSLYLPAIEAPQELPASSPAPQPLPERGVGWARALLVEDEAAVRRSTEKLLQKLGFEVLAFESGDAALEHLGTEGASVHVLVSDVMMPGMNGRELADRVRGLAPETPVVLISGHTGDVLQGLDEDLSEYSLLRKPFDSEQLARAVAEARQKQAGASAAQGAGTAP